MRQLPLSERRISLWRSSGNNITEFHVAINLGYLAIATIILRTSAMTWIMVEPVKILPGFRNENSIRRNESRATRGNNARRGGWTRLLLNNLHISAISLNGLLCAKHNAIYRRR